ncbi:heavy-metal-associated domain-containing protein [Malaciobacter marinus]|jgi:mercuric ion binding protein|uniref:heavy-metal-associated domain-containing protein n=1 Tax=Malaciobacter TaxID=2321114 RepID=UPI0009A74494|nr:heavy metal-associated domain-containing protein [Malaciobacter marinus]SKB39064.1 mercuric ion binding protein [Malaciobacter marinus]
MKKLLLFIFLSLSVFAKEVEIEVEKMHCPLCTTMVKKAIKKVDGVNKVSVKLNTKKATVNYDESKTDIKTILEAIKTTSYEGKVIKP